MGNVTIHAVAWVKRFWLQLAGLGALVAVVWAVNPGRLLAVFAHVRLELVALMVPVVVCAYVGRGVAWWIILRRVGVGLPFWRAMQIELAGQLFVLVPTGDFARIPMVLSRQLSKKPAGEIAGTIVIQEIMLNAMFAIGLLLRAAAQPGTTALLMLAVLFQGVLLAFLFWDRAFVTVVGLVGRIPVIHRVAPQLSAVKTGISKALDPKTLIVVCAIDLGVVVLTFYLFYLAVAAVGAHVTFLEAGYILALAHLASLVSLIPGGTGIFEGLATVFLVGNGVPVAAGVAAALLYRVYNDVLMAGVGAFAGIGLGGLQSTEKVS